MHRLILLFALIPLLLAITLRKLFGDRPLNKIKGEQLQTDSHTLAEKMLASVDSANVDIRQSKLSWAGASIVGSDWIALPSNLSNSKSAAAHGEAALRVGHYLLAQRDPSALAKRRWAIRFGHVFPIFTAIVAVFPVAIMKVGVLLGISIVVAALAIATLAQILTLTTALRAAAMANLLIEKKRLFPRLSDEEAVTTATTAQAWRTVVPGFIARLM